MPFTHVLHDDKFLSLVFVYGNLLFLSSNILLLVSPSLDKKEVDSYLLRDILSFGAVDHYLEHYHQSIPKKCRARNTFTGIPIFPDFFPIFTRSCHSIRCKQT